jgi:hypothetical protein
MKQIDNELKKLERLQSERLQIEIDILHSQAKIAVLDAKIAVLDAKIEVLETRAYSSSNRIKEYVQQEMEQVDCEQVLRELFDQFEKNLR